MKLFLLPISTRRSLIFCSRASIRAEVSTTYLAKRLDQLPPKISETWASWEKAEKGWKKQVTFWGNQLFKRIPYEEWGLKSIPTLTVRRKGWYTEGYEEEEGSGKRRKEQVEVLFPGRFLKEGSVHGVLERLAVERQALHRKRMWGSAIGAPLTLPFALIPVCGCIFLTARSYKLTGVAESLTCLDFIYCSELGRIGKHCVERNIWSFS